MKLTQKLMAAAVALAFSAGASASINNSDNGAVAAGAGYTGGSDLVFFAWSAGKSYVQDLGVAAASFLPTSAAANTGGTASAVSSTVGNITTTTTTYTTDFAVSSAYNTFLTASGANAVKWGVVAVRSDLQSLGLGDNWAFSTIRAGTAAATVAGEKSNFINGTGLVFDTFAAAASPTGYYSSTSTADNWATTLKSNFGAKLAFNSDNTVGTSGVAFRMFDSIGATTAAAQQTAFAGTFGFNGSNLAYTNVVVSSVEAIPEPETYAMMVAGLVMLGAIARRRKA